LHRRAERRVRHVALQPVGAYRQHPPSTPADRIGSLGEQARLADPSLAGDDHGGQARVGDLRDGGHHGIELSITADEGRDAHLLARGRSQSTRTA
jgi:hypothetical protein